jgi:hypothetical protein
MLNVPLISQPDGVVKLSASEVEWFDTVCDMSMQELHIARLEYVSLALAENVQLPVAHVVEIVEERFAGGLIYKDQGGVVSMQFTRELWFRAITKCQ